jgi:hypothetical protein
LRVLLLYFLSGITTNFIDGSTDGGVTGVCFPLNPVLNDKKQQMNSVTVPIWQHDNKPGLWEILALAHQNLQL